MIQSLSAFDRAKNLKALSEETFDLCIIGGGINGAGVARDAASRGMKVALIEARDFASGTSSRSSKLIHGGIRYLENYEFGLVFEALSERRRLFEIAPHLVHPLRFVIPLYKGGRVGPFLMGLGMWLYDALALFETPEPHEYLSPREAHERLPALRTADLRGAYAYSDAYMDDDRLVLETLRSAAAFGAVIVNYVKAESAEMQNGKVVAIGARDTRAGGGEIKIRARHFVSTVGPWTDQVAPKLVGEWRPKMRPSKGVHLTFQKERLPLHLAVVMGAEERIVFGIPRHEMVIVGTTDTDYKGDPADVHTSREDVDYLLAVIGRYFPGAEIQESDIVASYAGVRPLVDDRAISESKTSREHQILLDPHNVTFVMGGKYTTYRLIAEQTVATCLSTFTWEEQVHFGRNQTKTPLNPLVTSELFHQRAIAVAQLGREFEIDEKLASALFDRHGHEAFRLLTKYLKTYAALEGESRQWAIEAAHAIESTMCMSIADFFLRRTPLVLSRPDHGRESFLPAVERVFRDQFGLSDAELKEQVKEFDDYLRQELAWAFSS